MKKWINWLGIGLLTTAGLLPCSYGQAVPDTVEAPVAQVWDSTAEVTQNESGYYDSAETTADEVFPEWDMENEVPLTSDTLEILRKKKEFEYMQGLDSMLRQLKPIEEEAAPPKPKKQADPIIPPKLIAYLLWLLAIAAVLFILYQLFAGQGRLFARGN
nr:hypothetical protein [Chitinophagaceae bacterium]